MLEFTGKSFVNKKSLKKNVLPRVYINKNLIYLMCEKKRFSTDNKKSIGQENLIFMTYGHSHVGEGGGGLLQSRCIKKRGAVRYMI
jgi:hypothetical protein